MILQKQLKSMNNSKYLKQFWAHLVRTGQLENPSNFIQSVPHMSFVKGIFNVKFLKTVALKENILFEKWVLLKIVKN